MVQPEPTPLDDAIRIVHVDDEETQLKFAKAFLEMADESIHIESVASPEEALRLLKTETYDCVVSDYQMPVLNGIELARRIRGFSDIPIIIYTGRGSEEVAEAAFTVGIDDYIRKEINPSHYQVLAKRIRAAVEKHRGEIELLRSEELYRTLVEDFPNAISVTIGDEIIYANPKRAELVGLSDASELVGNSKLDRLAPEDQERISLRIQARARGEEVPSVQEFRMLRADGSVAHVVDHTSQVDWQGQRALLHVLQDITDLADQITPLIERHHSKI